VGGGSRARTCWLSLGQCAWGGPRRVGRPRRAQRRGHRDSGRARRGFSRPPKRRRSEPQQARSSTGALPCTRSHAGLMLLVPSCTTCMCSWSVPCVFRDTQAEFVTHTDDGGPAQVIAQHAAHPPKRRRSEPQQASTLPCTRSQAGLMLLAPSCTTCMCSS
jgi:hypothetical protein